jgi:hypothetical protein
VPQKLRKKSSLKIKFNNLIRGVIIGVAGTAIFSAVVSIFPSVSLTFLYVSLCVGLIFICVSIWFSLHSTNLYARFFYFLTLTCYFVIIAYRGLEVLLPHYLPFGGLFIIATIVFAHSLPMWNLKVTIRLREELFAPKSKLGKFIYSASIGFIPVIGMFIYFLITSLNKGGNNRMGISVILSILFWFIALILPFSFRTPLSPWEKIASNNDKVAL